MALCSLGNTTLKQRKEIFEKQKEEVLQEMEKLQKVLSMLNYKCWYYDQAIEKNDESYVQALSFNQFPPQIQQYYKHSHEDLLEVKKKILITLSIILILCVGGFGFYVNDYYHAQGDALEILKPSRSKTSKF